MDNVATGYRVKVRETTEVAEGTLAFTVEKPAGCQFRAGQAADSSALSRIDPPLLSRNSPPRFPADRGSICGCSGSVPAVSAVGGSYLTIE